MALTRLIADMDAVFWGIYGVIMAWLCENILWDRLVGEIHTQQYNKKRKILDAL